MKIALVISSMSLGGASRVMSLLANYWAARGDDVVLITLDVAEHDAFALDPRIQRIALRLVRHSFGLISAVMNSCRRVVALRRALAACGASGVVSFEDRTNVLVALATLGMRTPTVLCERTDPTKHRIELIWRLLRRLTYPLADALVVQTSALIPWAATVMRRKERVHVVPNPARDMNQFACSGSHKGPLTIITVGRLVPEKAVDVLVQAFADVAEDFPDWRLLIAGDGPERAVLTKLVHTLRVADRVCLAGWVAEPGEMLANASVFVMSSRYEGFPNALLEAMACGLPVISTTHVGSRELITDGVDGLLVDINNREQLAHAMRRLMKDAVLRARLGRNAFSVARRYSLDSVVEKWDALVTKPCLQSSS